METAVITQLRRPVVEDELWTPIDCIREDGVVEVMEEVMDTHWLQEIVEEVVDTH